MSRLELLTRLNEHTLNSRLLLTTSLTDQADIKAVQTTLTIKVLNFTEQKFESLILDVQVFKLRKTAGKRVRESVLQFDVFQLDVDEPACAVYKNFCH